MKNTILLTSLVCALAAAAQAGPESISSGKEMKQVVQQPVVADCPKWSGFYVGALGGFSWADADVDLRLDGAWFPDFADDVREIEGHTTNDLDATGGHLGGLLGYNFQVNHWVIGLEATGSYLWLRDSDVTGHFIVPENDDEYHVSTSFKTNYLATVGPRFGYAFCRWLPFVTGGAAFGNIDFKQRITEHDNFFREGDSENENRVGWFVGGGLEYAITDHWHVRGQYQYVDLGSNEFRHAGVPSATESIYTGRSELELREHNASVALIYQF